MPNLDIKLSSNDISIFNQIIQDVGGTTILGQDTVKVLTTTTFEYNQNYDNALFQVLSELEGVEPTASSDSRGYQTVGVGFNLDQFYPQDPEEELTEAEKLSIRQTSLYPILKSLPGITKDEQCENIYQGALALSDSQIRTLLRISLIGLHQTNPTYNYRGRAEVLLGAIQNYSLENHIFQAHELLALHSLDFNGAVVQSGLLTAITQGGTEGQLNALIEIIEQSNPSAPDMNGIQNRRLKEAALFYGDAAAVQVPWRQYQKIIRNVGLVNTHGIQPYYALPVGNLESTFQGNSTLITISGRPSAPQNTIIYGTPNAETIDLGGSTAGEDGNKVGITGDQQDVLLIGSGDQLAAGNRGTDQYHINAEDLTGNVLVIDADKKAILYINGVPVTGTANRITNNAQEVVSGIWTLQLFNGIIVTFTRNGENHDGPDIVLTLSGTDTFTGKKPGKGSITIPNVNFTTNTPNSQKRSDPSITTNTDGEVFGVSLGAALIGPHFNADISAALPAPSLYDSGVARPLSLFSLPSGQMELVFFQFLYGSTENTYHIGSVKVDVNGTQISSALKWREGIPAPVTEWNEHYQYASGGMVYSNSEVIVQWARYPNGGDAQGYPRVVTQRFTEDGIPTASEQGVDTEPPEYNVEIWQLIPSRSNSTEFFLRSWLEQISNDDFDPPRDMPILIVGTSYGPTSALTCAITLDRTANPYNPIKAAFLDDGSAVVTYLSDKWGPETDTNGYPIFQSTTLNFVRLDSNCNVLTGPVKVASYGATSSPGTPFPILQTQGVVSLPENHFAINYNTYFPAPGDTYYYTDYSAILRLYTPTGEQLLTDPLIFNLSNSTNTGATAIGRTPEGNIMYLTGVDERGMLAGQTVYTSTLFTYTPPTEANLLAENGTVTNAPGVSYMTGNGETVFNVKRFGIGDRVIVTNFNDGNGTENSNPDKMNLSDLDPEIQNFDSLNYTTSTNLKREVGAYTYTLYFLNDLQVTFSSIYPLQSSYFLGNANKTTSTTTGHTTSATTQFTTGGGTTSTTTGIGSSTGTSSSTGTDPVISTASRTRPFGMLEMPAALLRHAFTWWNDAKKETPANTQEEKESATSLALFQEEAEFGMGEVPISLRQQQLQELNQTSIKSASLGFLTAFVPKTAGRIAALLGVPNYLAEAVYESTASVLSSLYPATVTSLATGLAVHLIRQGYAKEQLAEVKESITAALSEVLNKKTAEDVVNWVEKIVPSQEKLAQFTELVAPAATTYARTQDVFQTTKSFVQSASLRTGNHAGTWTEKVVEGWTTQRTGAEHKVG